MPEVTIKSKIKFRVGTQAQLDALPVGQKPLRGEPVYTDDNNRLYIGVDADTDPTLLITDSLLQDLTPDGLDIRVRGGRLTRDNGSALGTAGSNSLDIQVNRSLSTHFVAASGGIAVGAQNTIAVSASGGIAIGRGNTINNLNGTAIGRSITIGATAAAVGSTLTNNVANTILVGHTGAVMRGAVSNTGWIQTILASATARAATASAIADAPESSLPAGYFGFRLNGNDLWVDANIGGTVRSRNLGTLT